MPLNDSKLEELRLSYGRVIEIEYRQPGSNKNLSLVVRKPKFDEYLFFNKYAILLETPEGEQTRYELDPEVADYYFSRVVIYPENLDISTIPVGSIISACEQSVRMSDFEDENAVRELYVKAIRNTNTQAGAIMLKIIGAFGIQGYLSAKHLSEEEIIELVVSIETITDTLGEFAVLTNMKNIPFGHNKKLNVASLLGFKQSSNPEKKNPIDEHKKSKLTQYYKSLHYTDKQVEEMLNQIEGAESIYSNRSEETNDGKIDMNDMTETEMSRMTMNELNDLKKQGKLMSPEETRQRTLDESKKALEQKIAIDREKYGESAENSMPTLGAKNFRGDLTNLLKEINDNVRNIE